MLVEHRLEMSFEQAHVREPLICEMARRCENVMFNIDTLAVGIHEAMMRISLVGEPPDIRKVIEYFTSLGVTTTKLHEDKFKGTIPQVPKRVARINAHEPTIEKKLWLTIVGSLRRQAFLWVLSRRYDVTYKITQSTTGDPVSIVSLCLTGPQAEVNGAINFLREQGINVEFGEIAVSAPFRPHS